MKRCSGVGRDAHAVAPVALGGIEGAVGAHEHVADRRRTAVFDGEQAEPYTEWDTVRPISVYGASKLAGEVEAGPDAAIVRTSWVCGLGPKNFVATVLRLADQHPNVRRTAVLGVLKIYHLDENVVRDQGE